MEDKVEEYEVQREHDCRHADLRELAKARETLQVLKEITGSNNTENPWLGVTAAVQLLKLQCEPGHHKAIIVYQHPLTGYDTLGPFGTLKEAEDCAAENLKRCGWTLQILSHPEKDR